MGQPRASRRKVAISSDEEEGTAPPATAAASSDDENAQTRKRTTGKLKSATKTKTRLQRASVSAQNQQNEKSSEPTAKSRTKPKTKVTEREEPKAKKPIYSFFNAATQRQREVQPSASPEKPLPLSQVEPEAIHDESENDDASVTLSKGSSVALAMRKRKAQSSGTPGDNPSLAPPATQKFRKTSEGGRTPSFSIYNDDKRPWTERFAPVDLSELAVHKRKVADVRQWLENTLHGRRQKVLVLKGAAGTGKTTTISLLARDMGLDISEWHNPAITEFSSENSQSTAAQFDDFVRRAGASTGLTLSTGTGENGVVPSAKSAESPHTPSDQRQLLLIEEFPNTFSRASTTLQSFRSTILQYVSAPPVREGCATPIIMIISETLLSTNTAAADSFTAHRLLGPELINHPFVDLIEFNPVAPTILQKSLDCVIVKEARKSGRRKAPGPQVLKHLAEAGDIRSAISSLEFLCLRGDDGDTWSSRITFTKGKRAKTDPAMTKAEEEALKLISNRESTLGIFHAVGKVIYNKRTSPPAGEEMAQPPTWLPQHRRRQVPENDLDLLIDELGTDTPTFIAALHENYALSCSCSSSEEALDSVNGCIDSISDADLLSVDRFSLGTRAYAGSAMDNLRQDEMVFQVATHGMLFNLPCPVHRAAPPGSSNKGDAYRMFYPTSLKLWKEREEVGSLLEMLTARLQSGSLAHQRPLTSKSQSTGVESWKRNPGISPTTTPDGKVLSTPQPQDQMTVSPPTTIITKSEALLERLPYMALTLSGAKHPNTVSSSSSPLLEQLSHVTRIRGHGLLNTNEDDDEDVEGPEQPPPSENWSTDKPAAAEEENRSTSRTKAMKGGAAGQGREKGGGDVETEGGGLMIPVETSVERLVLEEDDIED
ncbi:hypothetical protein KC331_g12866 [Hortaea werneckii]|uniref:Checkpoint protein RAD24-like helical bundle domain-containing protein n=1 Tax=Hortaea werneckii TaxID=91943 RepID=A0A3M7C0P3_HORWE|nr:hypothetical protein KC331_g12866 [Hortaea werneckii]KAI7706159.1 hypothetical protein KC353_g12424 [Hortaea werneckii]RMY45605.1 hypothetical protein D0865_09797 [Hortaea werneckii]